MLAFSQLPDPYKPEHKASETLQYLQGRDEEEATRNVSKDSGLSIDVMSDKVCPCCNGQLMKIDHYGKCWSATSTAIAGVIPATTNSSWN